MPSHETALTGGGHALVTAEIEVDANLPEDEQEEIVIHEVIECFCPMWPHDAVEQLTDTIMSGLEQLNVH
jgi:hypothetical protein